MSIIYCDGFTLGGNPAKEGGWTVNINGENFVKFEKKSNFTNNEAELRAVLEACVLADRGDEIITDSKNTLAWIKRAGLGKRLKARPDLIGYALDVCDLLIKKDLNLKWEKRDDNLAGQYNENELNA